MASATKKRHPSPVLRITLYERVRASMMSIVIGLLAATIAFFLLWFSSRIPEIEGEMIIEPMIPAGGDLDGVPDETLKVESPEDVTDDPSEAELPSEETQITETLEKVVELSDSATQFVQDQFQEQVDTTGKPGRADGTGRSALGDGPGEGGLSRAQRWVVRYSQKDTLDEYAKQLDYFGIELGAIINGEVVYVSKMSSKKPVVRRKKISKDEQRLYMSWQDMGRRKSDVALMRRAGVDARAVPVLHFYPAKTENMLAQQELKYRNRKAKEIRRTYFSVRKRAGGYSFIVTRQIYLR